MIRISDKGKWHDISINDEVIGKVQMLPVDEPQFILAQQKFIKEYVEKHPEYNLDAESNFLIFKGNTASMAFVEMTLNLLAGYNWVDFKWNDPDYFCIEDPSGKDRPLTNCFEDKLYAVTHCTELREALDNVLAKISKENTKKEKKVKETEDILEKK